MTMRAIGVASILRTLALVNSAPPWQEAHLPLPKKTPMPCCARVDSADELPPMKRSNGASSETSVAW